MHTLEDQGFKEPGVPKAYIYLENHGFASVTEGTVTKILYFLNSKEAISSHFNNVTVMLSS